MTRRRWWWAGIVSILMLAGALGGCDGDSDDDFDNGVCFLFSEVEPNDTPLTAQFLDDVFHDDCFIVTGRIFDVLDVDGYGILVHESLTLVVTLEHSPLVDFDVQVFDADTGRLIQDCGVAVVPEVCVVTFVVGARDIAVDIVVTPIIGAGTYTLTLDAQ